MGHEQRCCATACLSALKQQRLTHCSERDGVRLVQELRCRINILCGGETSACMSESRAMQRGRERGGGGAEADGVCS